MRFSERLKRRIWVAERLSTTRPVTYDVPVKYLVNVVPTDDSLSVELYGLDYTQYLKCVCQSDYARNISVGDLVFVQTEPGDEHDPLCDDADYVVESKVACHDSVTITLRSRRLGD